MAAGTPHKGSLSQNSKLLVVFCFSISRQDLPQHFGLWTRMEVERFFKLRLDANQIHCWAMKYSNNSYQTISQARKFHGCILFCSRPHALQIGLPYSKTGYYFHLSRTACIVNIYLHQQLNPWWHLTPIPNHHHHHHHHNHHNHNHHNHHNHHHNHHHYTHPHPHHNNNHHNVLLIHLVFSYSCYSSYSFIHHHRHSCLGVKTLRTLPELPTSTWPVEPWLALFHRQTTINWVAV